MKSKKTKITVPGASGASYRFTVHDLESALPTSGAVYFITRRTEHEGRRHTHARIYAGHAADVAARVTDHRNFATFDSHKPNCVCVLPEKVEAERVRIESDLISKFRPPCND